MRKEELKNFASPENKKDSEENVDEEKEKEVKEANFFANNNKSKRGMTITAGNLVTNFALPDEIKHKRKCCKKFRNFFYMMCVHPFFSLVITLLIVLNTFLLALDRYPISEKESQVHEYFNFFFTACFFFEMIVKLIGLGIKLYVKERFNIFDMFIVVISIFDMAVLLSGI